jgi:mannose-6-phosphate isomerase-like protein (cupin superfamily)
MKAIPSPLPVTILAPRQALMIRPFGLNIKVPLTIDAADGAAAAIIGRHNPAEGPPGRLHISRDKIFFVVEGIYEFAAGGRTAAIGPGTIVFVPRNVAHRFRNIGDTAACLLDWSLPAGQDHYFQEISKLAGCNGCAVGRAAQTVEKFAANLLPARHQSPVEPDR